MRYFKHFKFALPVAAILLVTACGTTPVEPTGPVVGDFFDFQSKADTRMIIHSLDEEVTHINQTFYTSHISADGTRIQQRLQALNQDMTIVLEKRDGAVRQVFAWAEFPIWEDITGIGEIMDLVILQEPLELGNTWDNGMGGVSEITGTDLSISTPAGDFTGVLQVTTLFPGMSDYSISYFAPGVGLVSDTYTSVFQETAFSASTHLVDMVSGGIPATIFTLYPDAQALGLDYDAVEVEVVTNQDFAQLFTQLIQANMPSLANVSVNEVSIDRDNGLITVDFSPELLATATGSGAEQLLLYSLANKFGLFFHLEEFALTVAGANYESGHITLADGETIRVGSGLGLW